MKKNLLLLGQGRIASEIIKMMINEKVLESFNFLSLVSNKKFLEDFSQAYSFISPDLISNEKKNEKEISDVIISKNIDLIISIQHPWILSKEILKMVNYQAFNLHNAKLPDYKGYHSISHALLNNDKYYFTTIHQMINKVDQGTIIKEKKISISKNDDAISLYEKTVLNSVELMRDFFLKKLYLKKIRKKVLPEGKFYKKDSLQKLANLSNQKDAELVDRTSRALFFPPYNTAFKIIGLEKIPVLPCKRKSFNLKKCLPVNLHNF